MHRMRWGGGMWPMACYRTLVFLHMLVCTSAPGSVRSTPYYPYNLGNWDMYGIQRTEYKIVSTSVCQCKRFSEIDFAHSLSLVYIQCTLYSVLCTPYFVQDNGSIFRPWKHVHTCISLFPSRNPEQRWQNIQDILVVILQKTYPLLCSTKLDRARSSHMKHATTSFWEVPGGRTSRKSIGALFSSLGWSEREKAPQGWLHSVRSIHLLHTESLHCHVHS